MTTTASSGMGPLRILGTASGIAEFCQRPAVRLRRHASGHVRALDPYQALAAAPGWGGDSYAESVHGKNDCRMALGRGKARSPLDPKNTGACACTNQPPVDGRNTAMSVVALPS